MKLTIGCSLLCVTLLVLVQMSGSDGSSDASSDLYLSRQKRGFYDDLIDALVTKFSKTVSKIFELDPKDFETFIRSLGRISKTLAKNILKKFLEFKDKNFDFGNKENFERVSAMMDTLDEVDQRQETSADSDADEPDSTLVGDLLGGLLALIVVLIIGLAVTVLFCKRKKSTGSPNNEDSLTQVNKLPDVPPRPSVRPQRPVPPQGNDDDYLTLVESTTQVNKPAVSSRPCPVPDEGKEDGYLTPMETTTQVIKQSNVPSQQRPFHTQGKEDNYLTPVESTTQNNEPPNVPSPQRPVHTQGKEDNYLTPVETTTQVNESNGPPRPAVRTRKGPVSDQDPEDAYLTPGERSSPNAPLVYDKIEQQVYLEIENPAEYTDLDVYDTIEEAKTEEYTTPYSTS